MLYLVWLPADPAAVARLVPDGLESAADGAVFLNQYVVEAAEQASGGAQPDGFGAYSLTYMGADLAGLDTEAGVPARWWTHYFNSSANMIAYALAHGVPASSGRTTLELEEGLLVATTEVDGRPLIRTTSRVGAGIAERATGQLRYVTSVDGTLVSGRYPFVGDLADGFQPVTVEFLDDEHPVSALRPADPLTVTFGFYSPSVSFCYPGGEGPLGSAHGS
jgi:hypothetical protein